MKPRRGTEAARATRHAAGWDRTNAAMPQWVGKGRYRRRVRPSSLRAQLERQQKNDQDKIVQKNGKHLARYPKQTVRSQIAEAWKKHQKYTANKKKTPFSMLQTLREAMECESNTSRNTDQTETTGDSNGGSKRTASHVESSVRPNIGSGPSSKGRSSECCGQIRDTSWWNCKTSSCTSPTEHRYKRKRGALRSATVVQLGDGNSDETRREAKHSITGCKPQSQ